MKIFFKITILFLTISTAFAQNLPNDCVNYIQACGDQAVSYDVSGSGVQEIIPASCSSNENNSLWLKVTIDQGGTLGFTLIPQSSSITEDYDFWVFSPIATCSSLGTPIRCSTTNPQAAGQGNNHTGLNSSSVDTSEGPGADGDSFVKELAVSSGQSYFIVIDRPVGNSPFTLTWTGTATILNPFAGVTFTNFPPVTLCDEGNDNVELYNFDVLSADYLNGNSGFSVTYFETFSDASFDTNPLSGSTSISGGTYYARVSSGTSGCFEVKEITVIFQNITAIDYPTDACQETNTNYATINLSSYEASVYTGSQVVTFSYYANESDAIAMTSPLTNWTNLQLTEGTYTYFVRVGNTSTCFDVAEITIQVLPKPVVNTNVQLKQCDDDTDGYSAFNLNEANSLVVNNVTGLTFTYFYTESDAIANANPIPNPTAFTNQTINTQVVYCRVTDANSCSIVTAVELLVGATQLPSTFQQLQFYSCDVSSGADNDGIGVFDFSSATTELTNYFLSQTVYVTYYETIEDALAETNAITNISNFANTTETMQDIYVRIDSDINNECVGLGNYIRLHVMPIPVKDTVGSEFICIDNSGDTAQLNAGLESGFSIGNYTYQWFLNNSAITDATNYNLTINQTGNYKAEVKDSNGCTYSYEVIVTGSEAAQIEEIIISDLTDIKELTIIATGSGDYEYSIDGENYQDSNYFSDVPYGIYTVYVHDKNECGTATKEVVVLGFPKYFTPNGDGINDYWNVFGINRKYSTASKISIFDRYGKLIKQYKSTDLGWDGNFNNQKLPATDYWCIVELPDGKLYKSHFSLLR